MEDDPKPLPVAPLRLLPHWGDRRLATLGEVFNLASGRPAKFAAMLAPLNPDRPSRLP